jgi:hypothetical protein
MSNSTTSADEVAVVDEVAVAVANTEQASVLELELEDESLAVGIAVVDKMEELHKNLKTISNTVLWGFACTSVGRTV